ncbi:hypothetical protein AtubIFM55763_004141 [Aspergillus tubingensis]|uniref:Uncharacterized protein n=2 Tax=Aspergillus subgen. Circumdati TaxID=2720871 RepID=A0A100I8V7_ASPNG|nr:aminotransferase class-III family protein [Aspergillus tubingensis]GAQ36355.1 hypothetical protein An01g10630 [Aspergillus niger]GFN14475.1 aminotransferase class-III family protein [Aspergillus tubingensis]GLA57290.1 hypothetical protein AtubIFM54640_003422 [Aspergillus tubingensis]GLA73232.1 hypothetical protein AtubIFM55763_004141 [Aspergillus tubingensis]GLA87950.1 hypothetical protein AtubIFM56815_002383 [Aspergillus tubingensis]
MLPAKNERKRAQVMNLLARKEDDESLPPAKTIGRGDAAMKLARQDRLMMSLKSPTPQTPRVITIQKALIGLALRKTAMICTSGLNIHPVSISTNVIRDKLVALARGPGAGVLSTYGAIPVGLAKPRPVYSPRSRLTVSRAVWQEFRAPRTPWSRCNYPVAHSQRSVRVSIIWWLVGTPDEFSTETGSLL